MDEADRRKSEVQQEIEAQSVWGLMGLVGILPETGNAPICFFFMQADNNHRANVNQ